MISKITWVITLVVLPIAIGTHAIFRGHWKRCGAADLLDLTFGGLLILSGVTYAAIIAGVWSR